MVSLIAALVGALAGTHAATWGMFKDSLYEGFSFAKYLRSVLAGAAVAVLAVQISPIDTTTASGIVVLFGLSYVGERFLNEFYKAFIRVEDQQKYFIPMAFAVGGVVVANRVLRAVAGAAYLAALVGVAAMVRQLELSLDGSLPVLAAVTLGSAGGWISAFGGAWKDAPLEGFSWPKFFRSPGIALAFAVLLLPMANGVVELAIAALGYTIASIETHKKFGRADDAPGKFSGKPVAFPELRRWRLRFVPVYAVIWFGISATFTRAVLEMAR